MDLLIYLFFGVWLVTFVCLFRIRPVGAAVTRPRGSRQAPKLRLLPPVKALRRKENDDESTLTAA